MKGGTFPVTIEAECECSLPGLLEVKGDHRVIEIVCYENGIQLETFGRAFHLNVAGHRKDAGALLLVVAPFFRGLSKERFKW